MRALVYADLQATDGHERCFTDPTKPLQLYRIDRLFGELKRIYREHKCDALWDLGDTTDDRAAVPVPVIDTLCDHLDFFRGQWNLKLVGNHEQFLRDPKVHAGKMFRGYFNVVDTCKAFSIEKVNVLCVSYHDDIQPVVDWLNLRSKTRLPTILLGHFQVSGCQMTSGMALTGVPRSSITFVNIALLGHIHKPQAIGTNAHYVGSPFQQHWGEAGENKRVAVVDFGSNGISLEWVPLKGFPRYRQVTFEEFVASAKEESEDRYKIILRSLSETEAYYAHPLANRADEVIYDYEQAGAAETSLEVETVPKTKTDTLRRYLALNPPQVQIDAEAMLEYGDQVLIEP